MNDKTLIRSCDKKRIEKEILSKKDRDWERQIKNLGAKMKEIEERLSKLEEELEKDAEIPRSSAPIIDERLTKALPRSSE